VITGAERDIVVTDKRWRASACHDQGEHSPAAGGLRLGVQGGGCSASLTTCAFAQKARARDPRV